MTAEIGHNQPDMTQRAGEVATDINKWLTDHPVIASEEEAREAKVMIDRGKLGVKDLEDEREGKVRPLNAQVQEINKFYRPARDLLTKVTHEVTRRITDFLAKEEAKRIKIAEEARKQAQEAEKRAREAEQREREALADADVGAVVDIVQVASEADGAFDDYQRQQRAAALAERETKVRIGGGITRSLSLRDRETLSVTSAEAAVKAIGLTIDIADAILKGARAYRKLHGELPPGIESKTERTA